VDVKRRWTIFAALGTRYRSRSAASGKLDHEPANLLLEADSHVLVCHAIDCVSCDEKDSMKNLSLSSTDVRSKLGTKPLELGASDARNAAGGAGQGRILAIN